MDIEYKGVEIQAWQSSASGFSFMIPVAGIDLVSNLPLSSERKAINAAKRILDSLED